jgi:hypothetical protein
MVDRAELLNSIVSTIQTYREGQIPRPDAAHVNRWVEQFAPEQQLAILTEMAPLMERCFLKEGWIRTQMQRLARSEKIAGGNPATYWPTVNFLRVQQNGNSQQDMLRIFGEELNAIYGIDVNSCGVPGGDYMYLDDIICTGTRVGTDLGAWIADHAPAKANLHVVGLLIHSSGIYYLKTTKLQEAKNRSGKAIDIQYWYSLEIENKKARRNVSEVLWPIGLPEDPEMQQYFIAQRYPLQPRVPLPVRSRIFTTEAGRQALENSFLLAGMTIRSQQEHPREFLKPLGFGGFGVGFGSTFATYRNCPNTAPLAIWWGEGRDYGPMQWYPLLSRIPY